MRTVGTLTDWICLSK